MTERYIFFIGGIKIEVLSGAIRVEENGALYTIEADSKAEAVGIAIDIGMKHYSTSEGYQSPPVIRIGSMDELDNGDKPPKGFTFICRCDY